MRLTFLRHGMVAAQAIASEIGLFILIPLDPRLESVSINGVKHTIAKYHLVIGWISMP